MIEHPYTEEDIKFSNLLDPTLEDVAISSMINRGCIIHGANMYIEMKSGKMFTGLVCVDEYEDWFTIGSDNKLLFIGDVKICREI
jgi:hypothetical protein